MTRVSSRATSSLIATALSVIFAADVASAQDARKSPAPAAAAQTKGAATKPPKAKPVAKKANPAGPAEQNQLDPEVAIDQARKALGDGKHDVAAQLAENVLAQTAKSPRNTARAMAVRGEVHLQKGRVAEAIVDLDGALWVTGGLQGAERQAATAARQKAMLQAGIGARDDTAPRQQVAAAPAVSQGAPAPPEWTASTQAPEGRRLPVTKPAEAASITKTPEPRATAPQAPSPPQANPSPPQVSSGGGVSGFFSKLFSGSSGTEQAPVTGAVSPARPSVSSSEPQRASDERRPTPVPTVAPTRAASTVVARPPVEQARAVAPNPEQGRSPSQASRAVEAGARIQLAAVRSRTEADVLAKRVKSEHSDAIGARAIAIEEEVYGNMGRFYRVRIGPFASVMDTQSVCSRIRNGGIDCMTMATE